SRISNYLLFIPFLATQILLTIFGFFHLNETVGEYFRIDRIGMIFLTVNTIISITTVIHSVIYSDKRKEDSRETAIHNAALVIFISTMSGVLMSDHLGLLWAFLEATTLTASVLIYHERNEGSLEAAWKYFFVCSMGIALSFVGILFLGIAGQEKGMLSFSIGALSDIASKLDPMWLKMSFLFVLTGFSVKMGVAPLFTVDIGAKDVSPSPIGAIFSGSLLNVGFVAIFRFYEIFSGSIQQWMNTVLLITGILSIFFAAIYIIRSRNYKKIFAYSSVEHGGIAMIALAAGGIGYFAVILHLIFHAFTKASLFYQIGQVSRTFRGKSFEDTGGYFNLNPAGGLVLLIGFFCITALPPGGLFISELMTFRALFEAGRWEIAAAVLLLLLFIFAYLSKGFLKLLFTPLKKDFISYEKVNSLESLTQFVLLGMVLYLGIFPPQEFTLFIQQAVQHLP
ncbi:MAG: proton-conducting transporter membrane subunit, partial [Cytophagaceae bacterium]